MNIKVSVLTPIYNHNIEYVRKCLDSLKNQTMQEIEFILIDNGATVESKKLIQEYICKDSRFKVVKLEKNQGYSGAINAGLVSCEGEYIGIVESDDWIEPQMYEVLYGIARKENVKLLKSLYYEDSKNNHKFIFPYSSKIVNRKMPINKIPNVLYFHASPWSYLYKKDLLDNKKIKISEGIGNVGKDIGFVLKAFISAEELYITDKAFYHYNVENSNSSMKIKNVTYIIKMLSNEYANIDKWFVENNIEKSFKAFIDKRKFFNFKCVLENNNCTNNNLLNISNELKTIEDFRFFTSKEKKFLKKFINDPKYVRKMHSKNINKNSLIENIFSIKNTFDKTHKIITIMGVKFKFKKKRDLYELKEFMYQINWLPEKVAQLHGQVFPQFKNKHLNDSIVITGCGPSLHHYNRPIKFAHHISLNRAIRYPKIQFEYAFVWDLPGFKNEEPEFIDEFLNYDCIKFVGMFLNDSYSTPMEINKPYKNKLYRCYSSSRAGFGIGACDPVIHQNLEMFPLADYMSISFGALHFALYTNPQKIYLVGLDTAPNGSFDGNIHDYFFNEIMLGYKRFQNYIEKYYPDTEIISVNPVGLKGMFRDVYTQSYVDEHPELLNEDIEILKDEELVSK